MELYNRGRDEQTNQPRVRANFANRARNQVSWQGKNDYSVQIDDFVEEFFNFERRSHKDLLNVEQIYLGLVEERKNLASPE